MLSAMRVSSEPVAGLVLTVGASAIGLTITEIISCVEAVSLPSCVVVSMVSVKSSSLPAGGVI